MLCGRYHYRQQFPDLSSLLAGIEHLLLSGTYILGHEVQAFEEAFAAFCETRFARGVNTGTDALVIALRSLGIGPGDEVITHANTFHATVAAIHLVGARPILVDALEDSFLINTSQVSGVIGPRTRAIMPVHLYGKPTPMREIVTLANRSGALLIEDAAQAHGAKLEGRRVGSFGAAGCFSFHPSKNLAAAGDGGAIVTGNAELAATIDLQRSLGQSGQNNHVIVGLNSKLDGLQALVLRSKLDLLDNWNAARGQIAEKYRQRMQDLPVSFQAHSSEELHVYHLFALRTSHRDALLQHLISSGVDAVVRYPVPIHLQPAFAQYGWRERQFPVAEALARELLCLPMRPDLTDEDIDFVTSCVRQFFEEMYGRVTNVYAVADSEMLTRG
jgi:dTDP-4-amino-4,6-dideoxygalactose transaminase